MTSGLRSSFPFLCSISASVQSYPARPEIQRLSLCRAGRPQRLHLSHLGTGSRHRGLLNHWLRGSLQHGLSESSLLHFCVGSACSHLNCTCIGHNPAGVVCACCPVVVPMCGKPHRWQQGPFLCHACLSMLGVCCCLTSSPSTANTKASLQNCHITASSTLMGPMQDPHRRVAGPGSVHFGLPQLTSCWMHMQDLQVLVLMRLSGERFQ